MRKVLKRYERGAEVNTNIEEGKLLLVGYDVDLKNSKLLLSVDEFDQETFDKYFSIKTGEWHIEDGWVVGKNPDMCPGMIVSKDDYCGTVMLEITAKMIKPSTHDINIMINGEWHDDTNSRGNAYVSGIEAFWHGNIGFEKSPTYELTAATQLFNFDPEKEYVFRLGNLGRKLFVMVNDMLCLEVTDPDPIDNEKYGKIGMEAFSSCFKFKNLRVYELKYERKKEYYNSEF